MTSFLRILSAVAALLTASPSFAEEIPYGSEVSVWVKGGIKPGLLLPDDVMVTVVPGIDLQRFNVVVELFARVGGEEKSFLPLNCGMGNEYHISKKGVPVTYQGISCHWPIGLGIQVPKGSKYYAKALVVIPTDKTTAPGVELPTAISDTFTSTVEDVPRPCAELGPSKPKGEGPRLEINTYASKYDAKDQERGILANRDICISVDSLGASLDSFSVSGGVYGKNKKGDVFIGSFKCEHFQRLEEKDAPMSMSIHSCNHAPVRPKLARWEGPLEVRLSVHLSSVSEFETAAKQIDIQPYPPWDSK